MQTLTCRCVGTYRDALTRGKHYAAKGRDPAKEQVRLLGDNGRERWFPMSLFVEGEVELPGLRGVDIRDDLEQADRIPIEVLVTLTTGERRWCYFATPGALSATGDRLGETDVRYHHGPHLIVATRLTEEIIGRILKELEDQDSLIATTRAVDD